MAAGSVPYLLGLSFDFMTILANGTVRVKRTSAAVPRNNMKNIS